MDSVNDICNYHFLCFVTIMPTCQGHLQLSGKKGQSKKNRDLELRYMMLGQTFAKNAKNDTKTLFEASKSVKNKIRKITVKSRNEVKSAVLTCIMSYLSHF